MKNKPPIPDIDPKSQAGKRLVGSVQDKLKEFLGKDYADESLAQYVVVMLAHKTQQEALASNLLEFLGDVDSKECASWWVLRRRWLCAVCGGGRLCGGAAGRVQHAAQVVLKHEG